MSTPPMALDVSRVQIGTSNGAGVWRGPAGTPPPTIGQPYEGPWVSLGFLSDDGVTISQDTDSEDIIPWQSKTPIRTVITSRAVTAQMVFWELKEQTLSTYFDADDPVVEGDVLHMQVRSDSQQHIHAIAIESRDGDQLLQIWFPRASLSDAGDMEITSGAAVPLDVTLSGLDHNGVLMDLRLARISPLGTMAAVSGGIQTLTPAAAQARAAASGAK